MLNNARKLIAARMQTWSEAPIAWENTPPLTGGNAPWVRLTVLAFGDGIDGISPGCPQMESGMIVVQMFVPSGTGTGVASILADSIADLFRDYASEGLICGKSKKVTVGESEGWYQINVKVPWDYTE